MRAGQAHSKATNTLIQQLASASQTHTHTHTQRRCCRSSPLQLKWLSSPALQWLNPFSSTGTEPSPFLNTDYNTILEALLNSSRLSLSASISGSPALSTCKLSVPLCCANGCLASTLHHYTSTPPSRRERDRLEQKRKEGEREGLMEVWPVS